MSVAINDGEPCEDAASPPSDSGLAAIAAIAGYFRIASRPDALARELALDKAAEVDDLLRAGKIIGLKARIVHGVGDRRLATIPVPAIACLSNGSFAILGAAKA